MKVAIIRKSYRIDGGAEKQTLAFCEAFLKLGADVHLLCADWSLGAAKGLKIHELDVGTTSDYRFEKRVTEIITSETFDLVVGMQFLVGADLIRLGDGLHSEWLRIKYQNRPIARFLNKLFGLKDRRKLRVEAECLNSDDKYFIANSLFVAKQVIKKYPQLQSRIRVIPNVTHIPPNKVNHAGYLYTNEPVKLLFLGSGWARKNLSDTLAFVHKFGDLHLDIYGSDKHEIKYRRKVRQMGLDQRVAFKGVIPSSEINFQDYQALIHLASYDPCPNAAIEALVNRVPVISSSATGMLDWNDKPFVVCVKDTASSKELREALEVVTDIHSIEALETDDKLFENFDVNSLPAKLSDLLCKN